MSSRLYEDQADVAQKYVVWLDKTYPTNSLLIPRLDIPRPHGHFLKWPDSLDNFHHCEFEMMGCSQKIVAPWVQWETPMSEQNVRQ